jgi:hypothetical protein
MMSIYTRFFQSVLFLALIVFMTACSPSSPTEPAAGAEQTESPPSVKPSPQDTFEPTATQSLEVTLPPTPIFTPGLECKALQDLNLRTGPGTLYDPPIMVLHENAVVVPLGYAPKGIPRGSWVMVLDQTSRQIGWVNAAGIYVSCNSDITALPQVAVEPPPPPKPPSAESSSVEGACGQGGIKGDHGNIYDCQVVLEDGFPMQFIVLKDGVEIGKDGGVNKVDFTVRKGNQEIYARSETNRNYCFFGGDDPCNPWVLEDYVYKWEPGGVPVAAGEYNVSIDTTLDNEPNVVLHWEAVLKIKLPQ